MCEKRTCQKRTRKNWNCARKDEWRTSNAAKEQRHHFETKTNKTSFLYVFSLFYFIVRIAGVWFRTFFQWKYGNKKGNFCNWRQKWAVGEAQNSDGTEILLLYEYRTGFILFQPNHIQDLGFGTRDAKFCDYYSIFLRHDFGIHLQTQKEY